MYTDRPTKGRAGRTGLVRQEAALFVHLRWRTANGAPLLRNPDIAQAVRVAVNARAAEMRCRTLAFDGSDDRVQAIFRFPTSLSVSLLAQEVMRASGQAAAHLLWLEYGRPTGAAAFWVEECPQTLSRGDLGTALDAFRRGAVPSPEASGPPPSRSPARDRLSREAPCAWPVG